MIDDAKQDNEIMFLASLSEEHLKSIEIAFNAEAEKLELVWQASAKDTGAFSNSPDLGAAKMIIAVAKGEQKTALSRLLQKQSATIEYWEIDSDTEAIIQAMKSLFVRLIMGGGKRKSETQNSAKCSLCHKPSSQCHCGALRSVSSSSSSDNKAKPAVVRISLDRKGRKGKDVTVITGLPEAVLDELATRFKKICGSGGTVKDGQIEVQGDHRDKVFAELESKGYKCKRSGG